MKRRAPRQPWTMNSTPRLGAIVTSLLATLSACSETQRPRVPLIQRPAATQFSQEELRDALDQYDEFFESTIKQAAADIDARLPDVTTRRATLTWKVRLIPANDAALKEPEPLKAFVNCWTLAVRMTQFLESGEGRSLFGEAQPIAIEAARKIDADIERVGTSFLPSDELAKARENVRTFAAAHPMRDTFADAVTRTPTTKEGGFSPFASILSVPLAPFRVAEGIDQGAGAIRGFTDVADRFTDIVQELPESVRWQLQLFLLDLDQSGVILSFLSSFSEFSCSASRLASTAERLPEELRKEASKLMAEIDAKQAGIQATLERAEKTAASVERALERVDAVAASIDVTGRSVADAGRAWEGTARQIEQTIQGIRHDEYPLEPTSQATATSSASPSPRPSPAPASAPTDTPDTDRPFEILDYRDTANALTVTAQELRALTVEVRATIDSQGLTNRIREVDGRVLGAIDQTSVRARSVTDHIAWRALQLLLLAFMLALVYRVVANRLAPRAR